MSSYFEEYFRSLPKDTASVAKEYLRNLPKDTASYVAVLKLIEVYENRGFIARVFGGLAPEQYHSLAVRAVNLAGERHGRDYSNFPGLAEGRYLKVAEEIAITSRTKKRYSIPPRP
ncbi:hypothetical protein A3K63_04465 [Candidatus Micrarchaeota archaeon RBG_16_49_10]|nr:MAG: hypothetical protein A3K63_04465 [Candidatus Micrarchaeota archaeon RBG_16_49_10]